MTGKKETTTAPEMPAPPQDLTEEQVADYLRNNPDFLSRNVDIVAGQAAPGRGQQDGVVDMQQFMVARLQEEIESLRGCAQEVIETGRNNMSNQFRTHKAVLSVLAASDFDVALRTITDEWPLLLDVDTIALCFEPAPVPDAGLISSHIQVLETGTVNTLIGDQHDVQLFGRFSGPANIFGSASDLVRSVAISRIYENEYMPTGLLALGSRTPDMFKPGQGTELLAFLTRVLSLVLQRWLMPSDSFQEEIGD